MKFKYIIFGAMCFQRGGCDLSSFTGKWKCPLDKSNHSYFHFKDSSIYAIRPDAKLSMEIRNFKKNDNIIELQLDNLKVHHAPFFLNVLDIRIVRFVRHLMKHGMTLEFSKLPNSTVLVHWRIHNHHSILQQGQLCLSKFHMPDDA